MKKNIDYLKAIRKGDREAELEFEDGWTSKTKIHKSKKNYSRNTKKNHEKDFFIDSDDFDDIEY